MMATASSWVRANWFFALVPPLLLIEWLVVRSIGAEMGAAVEAVVLFDLCVFMPLLHVICYRNALPLRQLILRTIGLFFLGVYISSYLVPEPLQKVLPQLGWARVIGLAVLATIEFGLLIAVLRLVWRPGATAEQVQAASGAPEWLAKLMLLEARFWRAVWAFIRGR